MNIDLYKIYRIIIFYLKNTVVGYMMKKFEENLLQIFDNHFAGLSSYNSKQQLTLGPC